MTLWQRKRWLRYLIITVASSFAFIVAVLSTCLFILSRGPVDLQFLKPYLSSKVLSAQPQNGFNFDSLVLRWGGFNGPFVVEGKNVILASTKSPIRHLRVPHLVLKFHARQLLLLQIVPRDIYLHSPQMDYDASNHSLESSSKSFAASLHDMPLLLGKLLSFKRLIINNGTIRIFPTEQSAPLLVEGNINLIRKKGTFHGSVYIKSAPESYLKGYVRFEPLHAKTFLEIEGVKLNPLLIFFLAPTLKAYNTSFKHLSCNFKALHTWKNGFETGKGFILIHGVHVSKGNHLSQDLDLPEVRLRGSLVDNTISLDELSLSSKKTNFQSQGRGRYDKKSITFEFQTQLNNLLLNDLNTIWPQQVAEDIRQWITANMRDGNVPKAHATFKGALNLKDFSVSLKQINGLIEVQNARLNYIDSMPKIEKVNALIKFDKDQFDIKVQSGMCNRLRVIGGSIIVGKLADPITYVSLNIEGRGSLPDVLQLINYKPLEYASKFSLSPAKTTGDTNFHLSMRFPIEKNFDTRKIETHVKAQVEKASIKQVLGLPIALNNGKCDVMVNDEKLSITGKGLLNGSPSDFVVEKFFPSTKNSITETAQVKVNLNPKSLKDFGLSIESTVQGIIPTEITFKNTAKNDGTLNIKGDLTKAYIKAFSVIKPVQKSCTLHIQAKLKDHTLQEIPKFEIKSTPGIYINGHAVFSKGLSNLKSLKINSLRIGDSELMATMIDQREDGYELTIRAKSLDLTQYLESHTSQELWDFSNERPIHIDFYADRLRLGGSKDLVRNNMSLMLHEGTIRYLSYSGNLEYVKDNRERVEISIEPVSDHLRRFTLKTDKAGSLFKCLGILENVRQGALNIVALHDDLAPQSAWEGKLVMEDFYLLNAPFLSHFVSLAFPAGLADLSKNGGLGFNFCKAKFIAEPNRILIPAGRANGYSLGFSFSGSVGRGMGGRVNMNGSIIPAYFLNTLISKIPLIGELLSGGKHEGLFGVSFSITGDTSDPQVSVNPLSILTPGVFRKLFSPFEGSDDPIDDNSDMVKDDDKDLQIERHTQE